MPTPANTRSLFVLRHAKSSWDQPGLDDHDRPLAPRGVRASELLSAHLRREQIQPALILCSSARRARETLELAVLGPDGGDGPRTSAEVQIEPALYTATASELIERLRRVPPGTSSVMLIGHNPALHTLVATLARPEDPPPPAREQGASAPDGRLDAVRDKFPTGALAALAFTGAWSQLRPGCAELSDFVRPRDLG